LCRFRHPRASGDRIPDRHLPSESEGYCLTIPKAMFFCLDAKEPKNQGEIKLAQEPYYRLLPLAQTEISP
jgi:hypothetical protein